MKANIYKLQALISVLLITLLILPGCTKDKESKALISDLNQNVWTLKFIENTGSNFITYYPDIKEKITIEFSENKQLIFDGVCNTGGGTYALENDQLTVSSMITTEIYCNNINWEEVASNGLVKATKFKIDNGKLIIYSEAGYNLVFE